MAVDLVSDDGYLVAVGDGEYGTKVRRGEVGAAWVARVGLAASARKDEACRPRSTYHHDGTGALVAHALDRGEIGLPVVLFDAVIEPDFDAKVGEEGGVLCEDRTGQENVGSLEMGWGEQNGEDEVESLPNTVSLTRA
jgi:hypothetical protein